MRIEDFTQYLQWEKKYSLRTVEAYGRDLSEFEDYLRENDFPQDDAAVDFQMVRGWVARLMEQNHVPSSVNRKISSLRSYFKYCLRCGAISVSPMARQVSVKTPQKITVPYSLKEMRQVLDPELYDDDPYAQQDRLLLELFYGCGVRCSELCGLHVGDLDLKQAMVRVWGKGGKERLVPLHRPLVKALEEYLATLPADRKGGKELLFERQGKKMSRFVVYRIINKYLGLVTAKTKKSPHVLRHTFATHLLEEGADISSVKRLLGHASLASTQIYTHTSLVKLKSVYNQAHPRGDKCRGTAERGRE